MRNILSRIWVVIFELIHPGFYPVTNLMSGEVLCLPVPNITCVYREFRRHSILNNPSYSILAIALSKTLHCEILLCGQSQIPNTIQNANEKFSFACPSEGRDNHQDVTNSSLNIWFEAFDHERDIEPIKEEADVDTNGVEYSDGSI